MKAVTITSDIKGAIALDETDSIICEFSNEEDLLFEENSTTLSELINTNIPESSALCRYNRFSHDEPAMTSKIRKITTLSGFIFLKLTGNLYVGYSEASALFLLDENTLEYDSSAKAKVIKHSSQNSQYFNLVAKPCSMFDGSAQLKECYLINQEKRAAVPVLPPQSLQSLNLMFSNGASLSVSDEVCLCATYDEPFCRAHREFDCFLMPNGKKACRIENPNGSADLNQWLNLFFAASELICENAQCKNSRLQFLKKAFENDDYRSNLIIFNQTKKDNFAFINCSRPIVTRHPDHPLDLSDFTVSHFLSMLVPIKLASRILKAHKIKLNDIYLYSEEYYSLRQLNELVSDVFEETVINANELFSLPEHCPQILFGKLYLSGCNSVRLSQMTENENSARYTGCEDGARRACQFLERYVLCLGIERQAGLSYIK